MKKEGLEISTSTGHIEGKKNRGKQRVTYIKGWQNMGWEILYNLISSEQIEGKKNRGKQRVTYIKSVYKGMAEQGLVGIVSE